MARETIGTEEWMKVVAIASSHRIPVAPHWAQEIRTRLTVSIDNSIYVEWFRPDSIRKEDELYKTSVKTESGYVFPGESKGFGIEIDEESVERYTTRISDS